MVAGAVAVSGAVAAVAVSAAVLPVPSASAAPPDFLYPLAGPSRAAMYPSGLEYDEANNRLVVADTGRDRILFYSLAGDPLGGFGEYGDGDGQLASPRDVAVDPQGNIYVADAENNRIQKFDEDGNFIDWWGGLGNGNETLNTPIGVTWDPYNNVLLSTSTGQSLIRAWDANGVYKWKSPTGDQLGAHSMRDVSRGPDGKLWVTAYKEHQIKVYDVSPTGAWPQSSYTPVWTLGDGLPAGHDANQLNFPYNVVFSEDEQTVYVSDTGNGRIARWDLSGSSPVWMEPFGDHCGVHPDLCADPPADQGKFNHLRRVAIDPAGNIYGADFWGSGIEVFSPTGTPIDSIEGASAPAPGFAEPYAVDVAPTSAPNSGQVYVMDRLNHRIQRFQPDGTYLNKVGARGVANATFSWPEGLTIGPDGVVWAVDTRGDRIEKIAADLSKTGAKAYGDTGSGDGQFNTPRTPTWPRTAWSGSPTPATTGSRRTTGRRWQLHDVSRWAQCFSQIGSAGSNPGQFQDPMGSP